MLDKTLGTIRSVIPEKIFGFFQPAYHYSLALSAAIRYRFPSRSIKIIGVTGTKGKSSTVEILNAILEKAGYKTALSNTIRFKIGNHAENNLFKMSMPGRFFVQKILRRAVDEKCDYFILEMTSQGAQFYRHKFIDLDSVIFTNISPEHIEAHGSYEKYLEAKLSIIRELAKSPKQNKSVIGNADDREIEKFLSFPIENKAKFSLKQAEPYEIKKQGIQFTIDGREIESPLSGLFNLYNILGALKAALFQGVDLDTCAEAIRQFDIIPGRVEKIEAGQNFQVIVDYAHTTDSLEKLYQVFNDSRKICVLGGTGGGRDTWKRSEMGKIADKYCEQIILTNEDPYDEDPQKIVEDVASGIASKKHQIIMDRREAIAKAISFAEEGDVVLITGKGTDPFIMGPEGEKLPWSDADIAREEIEKSLAK